MCKIVSKSKTMYLSKILLKNALIKNLQFLKKLQRKKANKIYNTKANNKETK